MNMSLKIYIMFCVSSVIYCHPHTMEVIHMYGNHQVSTMRHQYCPTAYYATTGSRCIRSCVGVANGDYQSCTECTGYVTCSNQLHYQPRACPARLVWDDYVKRCEYTSSTCKGEGIANDLDPEYQGYLQLNLTKEDLTTELFEKNPMKIHTIGISSADEFKEMPAEIGVEEYGCKQAAGMSIKLPKCTKKIEFEFNVDEKHFGSFFIYDDIEWNKSKDNEYRPSVLGISFMEEIAFVFKRDYNHEGVMMNYPYGKVCGTIQNGLVTLSNNLISTYIRSTTLFSNFHHMRGITFMLNVDYFGKDFIPGACGLKFKYSC